MGHRVNIWNRTATKAEILSKEGKSELVTSFPSPVAAVANSDPGALVLIALSDTAAVISVLQTPGFGAAMQNKTFVNLVSGSPDDSRMVEQVLNEVMAHEGVEDVCFIDGAYCGPPAKAQAGAGQLFLSCNRELADSAHRLLSDLGSVTMCGGIGSSRAMDYAVVDLFFVNLLSFMSNKAVLEREGVDIKQMCEEMKKRLDTVPSVIDQYNKRMDDHTESSYDTNQTVTLNTARNYWASRLAYNDRCNIPSHFTEFFIDLLDKAAGGTQGPHGEADITRLQEVVRYGREGLSSQESARSIPPADSML